MGGIPLPPESLLRTTNKASFVWVTLETKPQTVSPRTAQDKANFRLPLCPEIPSSHRVPKSPLRTDTYYVSENQGVHPCEAHLAFPQLSTLAEQFDLRDRTKETEPNSAPGAGAKDG